jgi:AraC-like DNA-binding protein
MPAPDGFIMHRREPAPELAGLVQGIYGYRETAAGSFRQIETASLVLPLIVSFGERWEIGLGRVPGLNDRFASFVAGLYCGPVIIHSSGGAHCLQVNLTPLGAFRFFGLPMHEIADRMVEIDDLPGRPFSELAVRLSDTRDWESRLDLAERFVLEQLRGSAGLSKPVAWAYHRIVETGGAARVDALAKRLEWSRKHLAERFRAEIGLAPKAVARVVRFNRAIGIARRGGETGWADIAAACGYADQAHLAREFRELAGATPAAWRSWPSWSGG